MNKTRLAKKRYRDKQKKDRKEIRLNAKKNKIKELEKLKKTITIIINNYKKQNRQRNYRRKKNMS